MQDYQKLTTTKETIIDLLAMPDVADIDFDAPKFGKKMYKPEDFI